LRRRCLILELTLLSLTAIAFAGCGNGSTDSTNPNVTPSLPSNEDKVTISQGAWGNVWFWDGNFMPVAIPGIESSGGQITPVIREIHVHRPTTWTEMTNPTSNISGPFFLNIPSELIAIASSDETGFYQIDLPPGLYSVFVKEGTAFYANLFDSQGRINPVEVLPGTVTKLQLDITYKAAF